MINPDFGVTEVIVRLIEVAFSLALPVALLFILCKIYNKLKSIEEHLDKN
jgi:hypothetical protein